MENIFGENLRYLRKAKRRTLVDLSEELGISKSALSDYETGKSLPGLDIVQKFSAYFDVAMDALYNSSIPESMAREKRRGEESDAAKKSAMEVENERYMFNLKLLHQKLESLQIQMQLVNQLLESREAENKTLKMNIRLLEAQLKSIPDK